MYLLLFSADSDYFFKIIFISQVFVLEVSLSSMKTQHTHCTHITSQLLEQLKKNIRERLKMVGR